MELVRRERAIPMGYLSTDYDARGALGEVRVPHWSAAIKLPRGRSTRRGLRYLHSLSRGATRRVCVPHRIWGEMAGV